MPLAEEIVVRAERPRDPLRRWLNGEEMRILGEYACGQRLKWRDVRHPNAARIRAEHQVLIAWMDRQVFDRDVGHVVIHLYPMCSAIDRHERAAVVADEKEVGILRVLPNHVDGLVRQIPGDGLPRRAEIVRHGEIRLEVVEAIAALR